LFRQKKIEAVIGHAAVRVAKAKGTSNKKGGRIAVIGNDTIDELGEAIKLARLEKEMTREELAAKLHITPRHLAAIENERKKPSFDLLFQLIHELHITADRLFYPETEHDHLELEEIVLSLCQGDDTRINTILSALHSLVVEKRQNIQKI
jgi:transcriptional regulator with XRE-family HTH domain